MTGYYSTYPNILCFSQKSLSFFVDISGAESPGPPPALTRFIFPLFSPLLTSPSFDQLCLTSVEIQSISSSRLRIHFFFFHVQLWCNTPPSFDQISIGSESCCNKICLMQKTSLCWHKLLSKTKKGNSYNGIDYFFWRICPHAMLTPSPMVPVSLTLSWNKSIWRWCVL